MLPARIGLVVNPIAGIGGRVGLKGSDGPDTVARALRLGAIPSSGPRAVAALRAMRARWPSGAPSPILLAGPGGMGEDAAREAGYEPVLVGARLDRPTSADDTRDITTRLARQGVDLVLFAGGDGTARDVAGALPPGTVALGIPTGVKIESSVFGTSPRAAGETGAEYLLDTARRTTEGEVLDLDEDAYRRGEVAPRLYGFMTVPAGRRVQGRKEAARPDEAAAARALGVALAHLLEPGLCLLGPGTTVRAVADALGVPKTLVGVDVVEIERAQARVLTADAAESDILSLLARAPVTLVVTPIGGQGFLFGRGNQPLSPAVIRAAGRERLVVVATPAKLAALRGRPLLVDTGDASLDAELEGPIAVVTGHRERAIMPIVAA
jgi:predicted polyphosphate/ATP-dependent NAD kinase